MVSKNAIINLRKNTSSKDRKLLVRTEMEHEGNRWVENENHLSPVYEEEISMKKNGFSVILTMKLVDEGKEINENGKCMFCSSKMTIDRKKNPRLHLK